MSGERPPEDFEASLEALVSYSQIVLEERQKENGAARWQGAKRASPGVRCSSRRITPCRLGARGSSRLMRNHRAAGRGLARPTSAVRGPA
jgi:hypothetical protein